MTKYILNSGGIRNNLEEGKKYFAEAVKDLGEKPRVLLCLFAYPRGYWERKFEEIKMVNFYPKGIVPIFELAFPDKFEDQIKNNDVIYIYGGDDHLLKYWFSKYDIPGIWRNKVVLANSASSNFLSKYFWTCDWRQCFDGLGVLPIKFLPHYKSNYGDDDLRGPINWEKAYEELKNYKEDLPIYALKEGEFKVFEI